MPAPLHRDRRVLLVLLSVALGAALAGIAPGWPAARAAAVTFSVAAPPALQAAPPPSPASPPVPEPSASAVPVAPAPAPPDPLPAPPAPPPPAEPEKPPAESTAPAALQPGPEEEVLALVNAEREDAGCDPLLPDDRLADAARDHSRDMAEAGYFSHVALDGRDHTDRILDAGYPRPGGENIARGQETAAEAVSDWMDSPGHRRNILDCSFATSGVGFDAQGEVWTQDFGR